MTNTAIASTQQPGVFGVDSKQVIKVIDCTGKKEKLIVL